MNRSDVAIARALHVPKPVPTVGSAIWLYLTLIQNANHRGLVVWTRRRLAESLAITEELVDVYLTRLAQHHLIMIKSPSPYLVISFPAWPDSTRRTNSNAMESTETNGQIALDVPVSSKQLAAALKKTNGVGGPGEGVALLSELEREFPDADRADLRRDLLTHGETIALRALTRVRQTPPGQIRKSRIALFRYLLAKLSNERP